MKVAVLPWDLATFLTRYLNNCTWSAICTSGRVLHINLTLAGGADLVVMQLSLDAGIDHGPHDLGANVLQRVERRHREVTALEADLMAATGDLGSPGRLFAVNLETG